MSPQSLLDATRVRFPELEGKSVELHPIEKGGSDRWFYRLKVGELRTLIVMHYSPERAENRLYVPVARFLKLIGVRVPRVLAEDAFERLIWLEDLGDRDLWMHRNDPWPELGASYVEALRQAFLLHTRGHRELEEAELKLNAPFDEALYLWEQHYFFEHCIDGYFRAAPSDWEDLRDGVWLRAIRERLASLPRVLVHRDFQSQNLIVRDEKVYLIDFQGMRLGLPQYDLASLLYDPYVGLEPERRDWLLLNYLEWWRAEGLPDDGFEEVFRLCALQRLMQALGAYGFLGLAKGRVQFLRHIPRARALLREVAGRIDGSERLCELLDKLPEEPM